jgi:hypothetical protein
MGKVIGQRWEIYDYKEEKDTKLKRGEFVISFIVYFSKLWVFKIPPK